MGIALGTACSGLADQVLNMEPLERDRLPRISGDRRGLGIAQVVGLALVQALAAGVAAFATRDVFAALRDASPAMPTVSLGLIAASGLVIALARVGERVVAERVGQQYAGALRMALFAHLARMSEREVGRRRAGALALRFVGDLTAVRNWVALGVTRLISAGIVLPVAAVVLFSIEPVLGAATALPLVLGIAAMALAGPRLGPAHRRLRARRARLAADMLERVPQAPQLWLLGRMDIERAHIVKRTDALVASATARAVGASMLRAIPDLVAGVAATALLLAAFFGGTPLANVAGAMAALGLMIHPLRDLAGVWDHHRAWCVAREKCVAVLLAPTIERPRPKAGPGLPDAPPRLRFRQVVAGALNGVDAVAQPRQKIAIVGGNGAGKSTLLRLAAGLEQAESGRVTLGGREPSGLRANERRRMIASLSSRSPMLAGSLRRALTMGSSRRLADDEVLACAQRFGLDTVLQRLGGLDGTLSEGGRNLSTGEVRRVLLARMALSGARLLLLDEPDDALDADGAELVATLVRTADATVLLVTHNLALARLMDTLWFLDQGRLEEVGSPEALLGGTGPAARHFRPRTVA